MSVKKHTWRKVEWSYNSAKPYNSWECSAKTMRGAVKKIKDVEVEGE